VVHRNKIPSYDNSLTIRNEKQFCLNFILVSRSLSLSLNNTSVRKVCILCFSTNLIIIIFLVCITTAFSLYNLRSIHSHMHTSSLSIHFLKVKMQNQCKNSKQTHRLFRSETKELLNNLFRPYLFVVIRWFSWFFLLSGLHGKVKVYQLDARRRKSTAACICHHFSLEKSLWMQIFYANNVEYVGRGWIPYIILEE